MHVIYHTYDDNLRRHVHINTMTEEILSKIGLSKKEVEVYLAMLKIGPASAAQIAREVGMARQTVYSLLGAMVESGFVEESDRAGVKQFFVDPQHLITLLERRKEAAESQRRIVEKELPKMLALRPKKVALPKVQYYEGENGLRRLFENILEQYKKGERDIFRGYGINKIHGLLSEYIPDFIKERYELGVDTRLFIGRGEDDFGITDTSKAYGRTVKRLDMEAQKAGMYLVGNRLYLFSYEDRVGVMIENETIARLFRATFEDQWERVTF